MLRSPHHCRLYWVNLYNLPTYWDLPIIVDCAEVLAALPPPPNTSKPFCLRELHYSLDMGQSLLAMFSKIVSSMSWIAIWIPLCLPGGGLCASVVHCASVVDVNVPLWWMSVCLCGSLCLCGGCQCASVVHCASVVDISVPLWWMSMCLCGGC